MNNLFKLIIATVFSIVLFQACASKKNINKLPIEKYITQNYNELKNEFQEAKITIVNDSIKVLFPDNVFFNVGSSEIFEKSYNVFERFANILNKYERTSVMIVGHTDNTGSLSFNEKLSIDRAESSKSMLTKYNVLSTRLHTWGMADRHPIATNDTDEGRAQNRRVEFIILTDAKQFKK